MQGKASIASAVTIGLMLTTISLLYAQSLDDYRMVASGSLSPS